MSNDRIAAFLQLLTKDEELKIMKSLELSNVYIHTIRKQAKKRLSY